MKKHIFIDLDGTLLDFKNSDYIYSSSIKAIQKARQNGHHIYINTGRSKAGIFKHVLDIGFDGLICGNGAYVEVNQKVLKNEHLNETHVKELLQFLKEKQALFFVETHQGIYSNKAMHQYLKEYVENKPNCFVDSIQPLENADLHLTCKVCVIKSTVPVSYMQERFGDNFILHDNSNGNYSTNGCELGLLHSSKKDGISIITKHLNIDHQATVSIGDGDNDLEMIQYANCGIAMGNSKPILLNHADYITTDYHHDGIYQAFLYLGVI